MTRNAFKLLLAFLLAGLAGSALAQMGGGWMPMPPRRPLSSPEPDSRILSPAALATSPDGKTLYVACATANEVAMFDLPSATVKRRIPLTDHPSGVALSADGTKLFVTCSAPRSSLQLLDALSGKTLGSAPLGHTAMAPVPARDEKTLFVCDRFNDAVGVVDLAQSKEIARIPVDREPVAEALTPDGKLLFVANHLPIGRADLEFVAGAVSVIDTATQRVTRRIPLCNGATMLWGICVSPDGRWAAVTHTVARFQLPTTQIERGWINNNAVTLIDVAQLKVHNTLLLDNLDRGAADPWAVAWSADGKWLCVTHAGTHELSVIDAPALLTRLARLPTQPDLNWKPEGAAVARTVAEVADDMSFLAGLRTRLKLPGKGPRSVSLAASQAVVGCYFSDSLVRVDLGEVSKVSELMQLGPRVEPSLARKGEMHFNDGTLSFQGWQSCAGCHSSDARVDALNWDLLNDGIGNPKNARSLLMSFQTPPSMSLGVRATAGSAVRAGFRGTMFATVPEDTAAAVDAYLQSLEPVPSPHLLDGKLSTAAERGQKIFFDDVVGCAGCHRPQLFTDLKPYDVGTRGKTDRPRDRFYTPTLTELWRTAPYLHDGSAATVRDVLTRCNRGDRHGRTSHLQPDEIECLIAYLLSL